LKKIRNLKKIKDSVLIEMHNKKKKTENKGFGFNTNT